MDRRSWPWKKKSSDKNAEKGADSAGAILASAGAILASAGSQGDQYKPKKAAQIQISVESYAHLTGLEEEVKTLNDQVNSLNDEVNNLNEEVSNLNDEVSTLTDEVNTLNDEVSTLNEKLSSANSELATKDTLVKQHAKVAEEAVSGWEKAELEASTLKNQLESVTLLKLTAENKASHLDSALKECMKQIRNMKEEHEKTLHDVILTKAKQLDKIQHEFEAKVSDLNQELRRASAENSALSRALQERSNMLVQINEEKSEAEAEIEHLKSNILSYEREISSLKYEVHVVSKEMDIRNEEKNMSMRSAEVANKQHLEGAKKIAKLEAECQRLRGLVRKKLPGPAALAQMKMEVENLGRDHVETRPRRSPGQSPSAHLTPPADFSVDNFQKYHKETEFLTGRLMTMEEETKMLKEALAKRNSELQASRNMCARTVSKLRSLEAQVQALNQQRSSPRLHVDGSSSQNASNPPSLTSMSEDGMDEEASCAEPWATALISELSHFKKGKDMDKPNKADSANSLQIMDDFLEMEKLACSEPNTGVAISNGSADTKIERKDAAKNEGDLMSEHDPKLDSLDRVSLKEGSALVATTESDVKEISISKLRSRISMILDSEGKKADMGKILEDIKCVVQDIQVALPQNPANGILDVTHSANGKPQTCTQDGKQRTTAERILDQELTSAICHIHDFVAALNKESLASQRSPDGHRLSQDAEEFSDSVDKVLCGKMNLGEFILNLSHVLVKACELNLNLLGYKGSEGEIITSDCIDKVTLLEKKVVQDHSFFRNGSVDSVDIPSSASDREALREGSLSPGFELKAASFKFSLEELAQLKTEKDNMATELATCMENLDQTKSQLQETEQLLTELKAELASSQRSNSLAETQLKCMAESYKSLETRAQELDTEVNLLRGKIETLDVELQEEKQNHQQEKQNHEDTLAKCKDLEEQLQRNESCSTCALSSAAEVDIKSKQESDIAAAAERLAECQETIFLLGRQLEAMRPPSEQTGSPLHERYRGTEGFLEGERSPGHLIPQGMRSSQDFDHTDMETVASSNAARAGSESPSDLNTSASNTDTEANFILRSPVNSRQPKHQPTKSSSSTSSIMASDKHSRGFSRFFSSKTKSGQ